MEFSGLSSDENGAHIHGFSDAENTSPPIFDFIAAVGTGSPKIGVWNYGDEANAQDIEDNILNGMTYVNIHTVNNGPGEIRGQILPAVIRQDVTITTETKWKCYL